MQDHVRSLSAATALMNKLLVTNDASGFAGTATKLRVAASVFGA
jgi:hypothetical protein